MMKLLTEQQVEKVDSIIEEGSEGTPKKYFITGPFMNAEQKNRNGRIYPRAVLEGQVNAYMPMVKGARALGELNHPNTPNVNLERASHLITELNWSGNDVYGKAKLLDTPMGKIAKTLVDEGVKFGVSTRGMGSVRMKNGINEVQNDFRLVCVDIVSDPSGPTCFVDSLMENAEWVFDIAKNEWIITSLQEEVHKSKGLTLEQKAELMKKFVNSLS